jgi:hypothetical protein
VSRAAAALLLAACGGGAAPLMGGLEARYRLAARGDAPAAAATRVYRSLPLFSRCRMLPSDSRLFDRRAAACGAGAATVLGAARLYLEVAADERFLRPVLHEGRLLWFDLPRSCAR